MMLQGQELPTILLVEDDQLVQGVAEEALTEGGFDVAIVASAEEAVPLLKGKATCRALVTDINLGSKIDGWEVARIAREIDPSLPVVYMTGSAAEEWPSMGVPNSILLTKPFAPAPLVTAVSQLLNVGTPGQS
jgi:CheY-like chemotaxis protein